MKKGTINKGKFYFLVFSMFILGYLVGGLINTKDKDYFYPCLEASITDYEVVRCLNGRDDVNIMFLDGGFYTLTYEGQVYEFVTLKEILTIVQTNK